MLTLSSLSLVIFGCNYDILKERNYNFLFFFAESQCTLCGEPEGECVFLLIFFKAARSEHFTLILLMFNRLEIVLNGGNQ